MEVNADPRMLRKSVNTDFLLGDDATWIGVVANSRAYLYAYLQGWQEVCERHGFQGEPTFRVVCPHGFSWRIEKLAELPDDDTLMPCGHEGCWAIRYGKQEVPGE